MKVDTAIEGDKKINERPWQIKVKSTHTVKVRALAAKWKISFKSPLKIEYYPKYDNLTEATIQGE